MPAKGRAHHNYKHGLRAGWTEYRYGSGQPSSGIGLGRKKPPALSPGREQSILNKTIDLLRDWRDSRWESEGAVRAGLRSGLVFQVHDWHEADDISADMVRRAFNILGRGKETRPTEEQGQPYYTDPRENCRWCHGPIPEEDLTGGRNRLFCSDHCRRTAYVSWDMKNASRGEAMLREAYHAVLRERTETRKCEQCDKPFKSHKASVRFCSAECRQKSRLIEVDARDCEHCGTSFTPNGNRRHAKFCCYACKSAGSRIHQPVPCRHCRTEFKPRGSSNIFCSSACALAGREPQKFFRRCKWCDTAFTAGKANAEFCSRKCYSNGFRIDTGKTAVLKPPVFDYVFRMAA